jgi:hypothetical protein
VVLQQVARVVPAAGRIDLRSGGQGTIRRAAVLLVALHAEPRVVPAPLLSHVLQKMVGQMHQAFGPDPERQRSRLAHSQHVVSGRVDAREVQLGVMRELPPSLTREGPDLALEDLRVARGIVHGERFRDRGIGERHAELRIARRVSHLAGSDEHVGPRGGRTQNDAAEADHPGGRVKRQPGVRSRIHGFVSGSSSSSTRTK